MPTLKVSIRKGDKEKLAEIAEAMGAEAPKGPTKGEASISALCRMMASGEVQCRRRPPKSI